MSVGVRGKTGEGRRERGRAGGKGGEGRFSQ